MSETVRGARSAATLPNAWPIAVVVLSAVFVQLLDVSIVGVAAPDIQRTLGASYGSVQLVLSGYQVGFASCLILAARLGDVFGRRALFLVGMAAFTVTSLLCATAGSVEVLVGARVIQGISSALMFSQVLTVIQLAFAPEDRGGPLGAYGATIGLGTILGPLAGGLLIEAGLFDDAWRAVFFVNVPICVLAFTAAYRLLPDSRAEGRPSLDITGAALSAVGLGLVIYGLSEGRREGWPAWILLVIAAGLVLLAAFVAFERRLGRTGGSPILDLELFSDRVFRLGALLNLLFYAGIPGFFFVVVVYLQNGQGFSALSSGLTTFAFALGAAVTASSADAVAKRLGNRSLLLGTGTLVVAMAVLILTVHLVGTDPHVWQFVPGMLLGGLGFGLFVPVAIDLVLAGVDRARAGAASGALATSQQIGGAVGVALIGILFFGVASDRAPDGAREAAPALRAALIDSGRPDPAGAVAGFERCFVRQVRAKDPTATPRGCPAPSATPKARPFAAAAADASARTFGQTLQWTLLYEIAAFALAGLLVLRLPEVDPATLQFD